MEVDQLAVEYERIRQELKHALSEGVRDMGAASQAMGQLEEVHMRFKAEHRLHGSAFTPVQGADLPA